MKKYCDHLCDVASRDNFHRVSKRTSKMTSDVTYADFRAQTLYDFFGLNFYAKVLLGISKMGYRSLGLPGDIENDMQFSFDPEGFYDALVEASTK